MKKRVRRTKEEKAAGITLEQKKESLHKEEEIPAQELPKKRGRRKLTDIGRELLSEGQKENKSDSPAFDNKEKRDTPEKERQVVVQLINNKKELQEVLAEEFANGYWEWKEVIIDSSFRINLLNDLGKEGWKFAFVLDKTLLSSVDKPNTLYFHRLKKL